MTTNKKKSSNFYTTANVKNRNRERKVPRPGSEKERGGHAGTGKKRSAGTGMRRR